MRTPTQIDPIRFEVIRNALVEATEEMASALRRSAYSTNIKTRHDFSCAVFDLDARTVAQSFSQPNHLGSLVETVPRALDRYGPERLGEGDGVLVNLPYEGGVHLNDITLISPIFYNGEAVGYVASLAHHVDVGGGAPASIGAISRNLPGGDHHPPGQAGEERADRQRRLRPGACTGQGEAGDSGGLSCPDRGQQYRHTSHERLAGPHGCGHGPAIRRRTDRVHRPSHPGRAGDAAQGCVRQRGLPGQRRLHGGPGVAGRQRDHRRRRAAVRLHGLRHAAPRPGEFHLRADPLRRGLRPQVPHRS